MTYEQVQALVKRSMDEHDKTYTVSFTRKQMRESAAALGLEFTDADCDKVASWVQDDVVDETSIERYVEIMNR